MRVLFVVPYAPNLVRTRSYNLIRSLAARGHQVTVLTLWANERERMDVEHLREHSHDVQALPMPSWRSLLNCVAAVPGGAPLQTVFSWQPALVSGLNGRSQFDVVHVEHLRGARYGLALKAQSQLPVVWDSVDCITHLFKQASVSSRNLLGRLRSRFELGRTSRYEGWLLDKFDHVLVTSPVDRQALLALNVKGARPAPVAVLGNGVDLAYFTPDTAVTREPATLVISGKMSYHANVTMTLYLVQSIMPYVWAHRPDVQVWIVGKDPTREIQALAEHPAVTVTGTITDLRPYLRRATAAVTPVTYGAGIQNKVLEAMACATPVITTPQAISALQAVPGRDVLVAEQPQALAQAILDLLGDPGWQQQLGAAGRLYVEAHHNWDHIVGRLEAIYRDVVRARERAGVVATAT